jgi:hypothetical protein
MRRWRGRTAAAQHDSRSFAGLLDPENTASRVWADTAYRKKVIWKFYTPGPAVSLGMSLVLPSFCHDQVHGDVVRLRVDGGNPPQFEADAESPWPLRS